MTIVTDILKQMPAVSQPQRKFLAVLFATILALRGRVTGRNLSRYCEYSERTIARQFRASFDWPDFHQRVMTGRLIRARSWSRRRMPRLFPRVANTRSGWDTSSTAAPVGPNGGWRFRLWRWWMSPAAVRSPSPSPRRPPARGEGYATTAEDETRMDFYKQQLHDHRHRLPPHRHLSLRGRLLCEKEIY